MQNALNRHLDPRQRDELNRLRVGRDLDQFLDRLRTTIRKRGFKQGQVEEQLGWSRYTLRRLLGGQKALRVEHLLKILKVIDVKPEDFFAQVYPFDGSRHAATLAKAGADLAEQQLRLRQQFDALAMLLAELQVIEPRELTRTVRKIRRLERQSPPAEQEGQEGDHDRKS